MIGLEAIPRPKGQIKQGKKAPQVSKNLPKPEFILAIFVDICRSMNEPTIKPTKPIKNKGIKK
jgi:hypothetical protein